ncbi:hypothetical protein PM082_014715 [Marasmius tenuissimus]|nr:hypothetical protein PM082_014715 [Marasmius tenuissimus]
MFMTSRSTSATSSTPSPPRATRSTIASSDDPSGSNNSQAKIMGGSIGGGGFLIILIVIFLLRRRRSKQVRDRLQNFDKAAAVIHPFTPTTPVSNPPRERKEPPSVLTLSQKVAEGSNHRVTEPTTDEQSTNPRQSLIEQEDDESGRTSTLADDNRPVDQASYRALQAQVRLLMQRVERVEGVEEAPPEYVSAYGST